jgi:hypothetical protein
MIGLIASIVLLSLVPASARSVSDFTAKIDSVSDFSIDNAAVTEVADMEIELTDAKVILEQGTIYLMESSVDRSATAFFLGAGRFFYWPPDSIEAQQVTRFYRAESVLVDFDEAYFALPSGSRIFTDLREAGKAGKLSYNARILYKQIRNIPENEFKFDLPLYLHKATIEGRPDFLWIDLLKDRYQHTIYFYNPYLREPVELYKYTSNFKSPQLVSSAADAASGERNQEYTLEKYDIDVDVSTTSDSRISCRMLLKTGADSMKIATFRMPPKYSIDSVGGDASGPQSFSKKKDHPELAVELSRFFYKGEEITIEVMYHANLFYHYMLYGVVQENLIYWYPYSRYRQLSDYDMTYKIDKGFCFLSVGEKVEDNDMNGKERLRFKSIRPIAYASFNYGVFDSLCLKGNTVPITIYYLASLHNSPIFGSPGLTKVADDIGGSFRFYCDRFGPYPFAHLDVEAISTSRGQGSPGFVHLSEITFDRSLKGFDDRFRAHEVAHQWWGHSVNPADYHDIWLSEGLAEYSAALYIELGKEDESTFRDVLKFWKKKITQKGQHNNMESIGFRAGAIYLGSRLACEISPGDYEVLTYYKAAYLLHMLRFELAHNGDGDGKFFRLLAEFLRRYNGRLVTTDDFIRVAREYLGDKTESFFNQWLFGWRVPKIKKAYKETSDGSMNITISVSEAEPGFQSAYPLVANMNDGSVRNLIYTIRAGENRFSFAPDSNLRVKSIAFNPDHDILEQ